MKCGPKPTVTTRAAQLVLALTFLCTLGPALARAQGPDDDWVAVGHGNPQHPSEVQNDSSAARGGRANGASQIVIACGERARPARPPYTNIMATLNSIWGTHARIYQSLAPTGPHARRGGCIFYNRKFLGFLTRKWMGIRNPEDVRPMLYAIFAHELGHLVHHDLSPARANVPIEQRELEADRFAGYTLWQLSIRFDAEELATYYRVVGDDFFGARNNHGSGKQRAQAFEDGYDLARMGLPESNGQPAAGLSAP
jgi:hypothetical protein